MDNLKNRPKIKRSTVKREFDYTNIAYLQRFMTQTGKVKPRKYTGNTATSQKALSQAVKRARQMALIPYTIQAK